MMKGKCILTRGWKRLKTSVLFLPWNNWRRDQIHQSVFQWINAIVRRLRLVIAMLTLARAPTSGSAKDKILSKELGYFVQFSNLMIYWLFASHTTSSGQLWGGDSLDFLFPLAFLSLLCFLLSSLVPSPPPPLSPLPSLSFILSCFFSLFPLLSVFFYPPSLFSYSWIVQG